MKFGIGDLHIIAVDQLWVPWKSAQWNPSLLKGVSEISPLFSVLFDLDKIPYWRCPQKFGTIIGTIKTILSFVGYTNSRPYIPHLLFDVGEIQHKTWARDAVGHLWDSCQSSKEGRAQMEQVHACNVKQGDWRCEECALRHGAHRQHCSFMIVLQRMNGLCSYMAWEERLYGCWRGLTNSLLFHRKSVELILFETHENSLDLGRFWACVDVSR